MEASTSVNISRPSTMGLGFRTRVTYGQSDISKSEHPGHNRQVHNYNDHGPSTRIVKLILKGQWVCPQYKSMARGLKIHQFFENILNYFRPSSLYLTENVAYDDTICHDPKIGQFEQDDGHIKVKCFSQRQHISCLAQRLLVTRIRRIKHKVTLFSEF